MGMGDSGVEQGVKYSQETAARRQAAVFLSQASVKTFGGGKGTRAEAQNTTLWEPQATAGKAADPTTIWVRS